MSYEIIYDKQFIRVKDKFCPLILCGSNNYYEAASGRRARDFSPFPINEKRLLTAGEILKQVDEIRETEIERDRQFHENPPDWAKDSLNDHYSDDSFGYYTAISVGGSTRTTTFQKFKNVFTSGIKNALTVEELAEKNIRVKIHTQSFYYDDKNEMRDELKAKGREILPDYIPATTDEFLQAVDKFTKNYEGTKTRWYITFHNARYVEDRLKQIRKKQPSERKLAEIVTVQGAYCIYIPSCGGYLYRKTSRGYRYTYTPNNHHAYLSQDKADKVAAKYGLIVKHCTGTFNLKAN